MTPGECRLRPTRREIIVDIAVFICTMSSNTEIKTEEEGMRGCLRLTAILVLSGMAGATAQALTIS